MTPARTKTPIRFAAQSLVLALLAGLTTLTSASPAAAQVPLNWKRPVQVKRRDGQRIVAITPLQAEAYLNRHPLRPGDEFVIGVHLTIAPNWHLFANPKGPGNVGADLTLTGVDHPSFESLPSRYPGGTRYDEPELKVWNWVYFDKATVYLPARVKDEAQTGDYMLQIELRGQVCDALNCVPFTGTAEIPVQVAAAGTPSETQHADIFASFPTTPAPPERASPEPHAQGGSDNAPPPAPLAPGPAENSQVDAPQPTTEIAVRETAPLIGRATTSAGGGGTLWAYLLSCFGLGFVAALTPCFYPMIPVTVTFFLKQAEKRGSRPLALASVYSLTIVASFTAAGAILGTALSGLGANPLLNLAFGLLLIIFGMALVGIFEIPVPQRMARWSSHGEAQGGVVGVMFMALTLLIVGTPCIAPMWGPVLANANTVSGLMVGPINFAFVLGATCFSLALALPFFGLALAPGMLSALPKSGGWMTTVKVVMGFFMVGLAFKFLTIPDAVWGLELLGRALLLSIWMALTLAAGLYLLGVLRTDHDAPAQGISGGRMLLGTLCLAWAFYLSSGLLQPLHGIEQWLPEGPPAFARAGGQQLSWPELSFEEALAQAKQVDRPLFLDFTGETCTVCKIMERKYFPRPAVRERLERMARAKLYTDRQTPQDKKNKDLLWERFQVVGPPFYAVVTPNGEALGTFPSLASSEAEFVAFLDQALARWQGRKGSLPETQPAATQTAQRASPGA